MKIIGHRGAAGTELENTLASLQTAIEMGVYAIELDIRRTKDNVLVVCHDGDLQRVSDNNKSKINGLSLLQLQKIPLLFGATVPTLSEALDVIGRKRVIIELKESGCTELLLKIMKDHPNANIEVCSFKLNELATLRKLAPKLTIYGSERTKPFDIIHNAKRLRLNGVCLNYWLLNPLTYFLCKRAKLTMWVYTVNNKFLGTFLSKLYPDIAICSDYPERFISKKRLKR